jgi:NCAIR mutase (PurE)-related protein
MTRDEVLALLQQVKRGGVSPEDALRQVERGTFEDLGFAKLDHQRSARLGFPEVVFAQGKSDEHLRRICEQHLQAHTKLLVTRLEPERHAALAPHVPGGHFNAMARTLSFGLDRARPQGLVAVVCAGTSDLPVAEEALETARLMDCNVELTADVGVAGLHRLLAHIGQIRQARVVIVVAGMEGALPSVVGGLVRAPLIAVPTSVGYGASFGGLTALLAMMNSCAPGVTVVNIDNGFGAGFAAALINNPATE